MHALSHSRLYHLFETNFEDVAITIALVVLSIALIIASFAFGVVDPEAFEGVGLG